MINRLSLWRLGIDKLKSIFLRFPFILERTISFDSSSSNSIQLSKFRRDVRRISVGNRESFALSHSWPENSIQVSMTRKGSWWITWPRHVEKMFPACIRASSSTPCIVCLRSFYRSWSREKENERKVGHAMNAKDRCSRSFTRGLPVLYLGFPSFSIRFVENHDAFYPPRTRRYPHRRRYPFLIASFINPVLIARITRDDRAVIFAIR